MLDQITPLILTYNEAPNIARALAGVSWAKDVVVVDSFSDDETVAIAKSSPQVRVFQRTFDNHRDQWEFGLKETGITTPWVLALDADYVVSNELIAELEQLQPEGVAYRANFVYCINGKRLRSGIYPAVTVLYRREGASYVQDGHTQRVAVQGPIGELRTPLMHDDRKSLRRWFRSQTRYTELEAQKLLTADSAELGLADRLRRWIVIVPPVMLVYCLILRGGILDGWQGFYYAFQRTAAELMLSINLGRGFMRINADVHSRY
ncbi:MAG TPA: glycosyltransferase family 2 protein [Pyrinomonadaceae bacterium]|jgi:glycosyltransferase involved in cell wall biosynthesis|nr:glycosyltransferase family 2 protein [Pyrinomonadaceae bacterium]